MRVALAVVSLLALLVGASAAGKASSMLRQPHEIVQQLQAVELGAMPEEKELMVARAEDPDFDLLVDVAIGDYLGQALTPKCHDCIHEGTKKTILLEFRTLQFSCQHPLTEAMKKTCQTLADTPSITVYQMLHVDHLNPVYLNQQQCVVRGMCFGGVEPPPPAAKDSAPATH